MRTLAMILVLAAIALPAHAETATVTVTKNDCRHVVAHTPDASVSYTPGSTADGRSVAPADLSGGYKVKPPETFSMDINIDLQERFGLPANKGQYMGELKAGKVEIEDGKAYYNGQELAAGAQNAVAEACAKLQKQ
jgi:hypothetical protein